jgi:hypothetical protein
VQCGRCAIGKYDGCRGSSDQVPGLTSQVSALGTWHLAPRLAGVTIKLLRLLLKFSFFFHLFFSRWAVFDDGFDDGVYRVSHAFVG